MVILSISSPSDIGAWISMVRFSQVVFLWR
jgi:hypothetical protein